jgi:hypothetical protein
MATRAQISGAFSLFLNTRKSTAALTHGCAFRIVVKLVTDSTSIAFMDVKMFTVNNTAHGSHDTVSATRSSFHTALSNKPMNMALRFCKINSTHGKLKQVAAALLERIITIDDNANAKHDNAIAPLESFIVF